MPSYYFFEKFIFEPDGELSGILKPEYRHSRRIAE